MDACVYQLNEPKTDPAVCTVAHGTDADSFVWYEFLVTMFYAVLIRPRYDELHPSEQSDRVVAREIAGILEGKDSKYATWFS